jgi:hypothetical protein
MIPTGALLFIIGGLLIVAGVMLWLTMVILEDER